MKLIHFDVAHFLRVHWQKQPLLIRNPWDKWANPLEPDELAGLACEEGVESRLIEREGEGLRMESGPLPEDRFARLARGPWTLLVQAVDHHAPEVAALLEPFRFIPDWRIDDVMVSYAVDGGGVGPHYDQYDVFLIQGLGQRRWRIGPRCSDETPLLPHDDLRLIADFEPTQEWLLSPGDILYVPPGFAHDGVAASDDCMTYSVGMRAPSRADLVRDYCDFQVDTLTDDDRYADPDLAAQANPGEIDAAALDRLHALVMTTLADRDAFARWFGGHISLPKFPEVDWAPDTATTPEAVQAELQAGAGLSRNPASRFAFIQLEEEHVTLFIDGESFDCAGPAVALATQLCAGSMASVGAEIAQDDAAVAIIVALVNRGSVALDGPAAAARDD